MSTKTESRQNPKSLATKQAILLLVNKLSGRIGKTQLVKLLFLADLQYYKLKREQLTDLTYSFHHFGPFDKKIDAYLGELEKEGLIKVEKEQRSDEGYYFRYRAITPNEYENLNVSSYAILEETAGQYGRLPLDALLDVVYSLMANKARRGQTIDFAQLIK